MKWVRIIGFPLSALGLVLYSPPLVRLFTTMWGDSGRVGGLIVFAVGWAMLLGDLVFHMGFNAPDNK
jgi:hypothetical protein